MPVTDTAVTTCPEQVGAELRAARERAGLTRAQLAARAGCSMSMLGDIEAGAVPRRSAVLGRVQAVLDEATRGTQLVRCEADPR
jgi:transcriptional regulator with XRE-family HTH domain